MTRIGRYAIALAGWLGLCLLVLAVLPFSDYAVDFGLQGFGVVAGGPSRFFPDSAPLASAGIALHMVAGGMATALAPLQLAGPVRRRWPGVHRWIGRLVVVLALATGIGGLAFIAGRGTIGGAQMSTGFAVYGLAVAVAAAVAWRLARAGELARHRRWALRLLVLILGSWIYRVLYGVWELSTGGAGSEPDFSGPFDLAMNWAFFVPGLLALELWFLRERRAGAPA